MKVDSKPQQKEKGQCVFQIWGHGRMKDSYLHVVYHGPNLVSSAAILLHSVCRGNRDRSRQNSKKISEILTVLWQTSQADRLHGGKVNVPFIPVHTLHFGHGTEHFIPKEKPNGSRKNRRYPFLEEG